MLIGFDFEPLKKLMQGMLHRLGSSFSPAELAQPTKEAMAKQPAAAAEVAALSAVCDVMRQDQMVTVMRLALAPLQRQVELAKGFTQLEGALAEAEPHRKRQLAVRALDQSAGAAVLDTLTLSKRIFAYLGPGHWLYLAMVSRLMRACYMLYLAEEAPMWLLRTCLDAALSSVGALRYALAVNRCAIVQDENWKAAVGKYRVAPKNSPLDCINLAKAANAAGMRLDEQVCYGAVITDNIRMLDWLVENNGDLEFTAPILVDLMEAAKETKGVYHEQSYLWVQGQMVEFVYQNAPLYSKRRESWGLQGRR